ncbi:MAG: class I SAM-dependent methyltransferase [Deltaproteobacteria bacterium]|nr:class I SAM-dependent methyltransferase [Deltaproteobacteria bacterium]
MPKKRATKTHRPTLASRAERYALYQRAVQDPEPEVNFVQRVYKRARGRAAVSFKEDFCATALLATTWVKGHRARTATGVDISAEPLDWGRAHVLAPEPDHVRDRVTLVQANVLDAIEPKVDVVGAFNFSYLIFKKRAELVAYFKRAYESLNDEGMFFCDLFGGTEAIVPIVESRKVKGGFTYVWEHEQYNPITNEILCHIHFKFRDGSEIQKAYTYDWRLWSIPEVRECLEEAGFRATQVWWDPTDDEDYRLSEKEENQLGWLVYIAAIK